MLKYNIRLSTTVIPTGWWIPKSVDSHEHANGYSCNHQNRVLEHTDAYGQFFFPPLSHAFRDQFNNSQNFTPNLPQIILNVFKHKLDKTNFMVDMNRFKDMPKEKVHCKTFLKCWAWRVTGLNKYTLYQL
jgi:hypothetical protein